MNEQAERPGPDRSICGACCHGNHENCRSPYCDCCGQNATGATP